MQYCLLVAFVTFLFAMKCFTSSGLFRFVFLLMAVSILSNHFIVLSAFPLFFIWMSMFKMDGFPIFLDGFSRKPAGFGYQRISRI